MKRALLALTLLASPALATETLQPVTGLYGDLSTYRTVDITSLDDSGPGTLRTEIEKARRTGPIRLDFKVSGTVHLKAKLPIRNDKGIYVDGGGRITIEDAGVRIASSNVVFQNMRMHVGNRPGGEKGDERDGIQVRGDASTGYAIRNIIIQHNSVLWSCDEIISLVSDGASDIVVADNIFAEPLRNSGMHSDDDGTRHNFTALVQRGTTRVRFYRNLLAHGVVRNPKLGDGADALIANNLIYNPGDSAIHFLGGSAGSGFAKDPSLADVVNNLIVPGVNTKLTNGRFDDFPFDGAGLAKGSRLHIANNAVWVNAKASPVPWNLDTARVARWEAAMKLDTAPNYKDADLRLLTLMATFEYILTHAGAWPRDATDNRVVSDVRLRRGSFIDNPPPTEFVR